MITEQGYVYDYVQSQVKHLHVLAAEAALGKPLPKGTVVHHINEDKADNRNENLLICTRAYHNLIHKRMRALAACGDPNAYKCKHCGEYDSKVKRGGYHTACHNAYQNKRRAASC